MKKLLLLSLVLALLLPLALASCGGDGEKTTPAATTPPAATTTEAPATTTAPPVTGEPTVTPGGDDAERPLFTLNLSTTLPSNVGKYDIEITAQSTLERFFAARAELPEEVTVLERVDLADYPASAANVLYVAKGGNDGNPGTKEAPLASLAAAIGAMTGKGGGVIYIMEGSYSVADTLTLSAAHSGSLRSPLFIKSYEDDEVTLTSNLVLSEDDGKWQRIEETDPIYDRLPEAVRDQVIRTSVADHGLAVSDIAEINKEDGPPRLYVGGKEYTLARYPNDTGDIKDLLYFTSVYDRGAVTSETSMHYPAWVERCEALGKDPATWLVGWEIAIPTDDARGQEIMSWVNTGDIWCYGSTYEGWEFSYYQIALETEGQSFAHNADGTAWVPGSGQTPYVGCPKEDGGLSLKSVHHNIRGAKHSTNSPAKRNTYYLFNAVEAMDAPGEWYLDRESGVLYLIPEEDFYEETVAFSNVKAFDLLLLSSAKNVVIDGLRVDGANGYGIQLYKAKDVVLQNLTVTNTLGSSVYITSTSERVAVLYSDFSAAGGSMVKGYLTSSFYNLKPCEVVVQNCVFHDASPTYQYGVQISGCRMVVSHNYFNNTTVGASQSTECIVEYNRFEGGSADVSDGGMIYTWGVGHVSNHYRYNLIHMFNQTHIGIYNDGSSSHHYTYGNLISHLGSRSTGNKAWYSSSGRGNVCYGNTVLLRDPYTVGAVGVQPGETVTPAKTGDLINESALYYYYFGDEYSAGGTSARCYPVAYDGTRQLETYITQSQAGHKWMGIKEDERLYYIERGDEAKWADRDPQHMNRIENTRIIMEAYENSDYRPGYFYVPWQLSGKTYTATGVKVGTVVQIPQYTYLDASGEPVTVPAHSEIIGEDGAITLTYEELAAIERFHRQPAACVVANNLILGGTPEKDKYGEYTDVADPEATVTNGAIDYYGYVYTTMVDKNYFEYHYEDVMTDPENYNYDIFPYMYDEFAKVMDEDGLAMVEDSLWYDSGLSYTYDYSQWHK